MEREPIKKNRVSPKTIEAGKTFLTAMLVAAMFSACGNENKDEYQTSVSSISLDTSSIVLAIGEEYLLTANVLPESTAITIVWTSSNAGKAAVTNGKVTALAEGSAVITAQAGEKTAACTVTIKDGVRINGVIWAKYNVDNVGTFAASSESAGKLYQYNRKTAWAVTGSVTGWENVPTTEMEWLKKNDPLLRVGEFLLIMNSFVV